MTEERIKVWVDYTQHLCKKEQIDALSYMKGAKLFIETAESLNKRGYKKFLVGNAYRLALHPGMRYGILELLDFLGVGFKNKVTQKKEDKLEKLSILSEKNTQGINKYANYLMTEFDYSRSTIYTYLSGLKSFFKYSNEFNMENCRRYIATLTDEGLNPKTIRLRITSLESYGNFIGKPIKLKRPKCPRQLHVDNIPTEQEYERLLSYLRELEDKRWYFYVKILATTGARVSEFLQFKWENVLDGQVVLKGKGNKYRRFFFSKSLTQEVKEHLKVRPCDGVICVNRLGKPMTARGFDQFLKSCAEKCNIDKSKLHAHAFRHFFAKMYLKKTKDVVQLAELLGHESIDTTRIYLQKSYEEQKRDFNRNITW